MKKYLTLQIGKFRSESDNGNPVKTYVYHGIENGTVYVVSYSYGEEMYGWEKVKEYKGKGLYKQDIHLRLESLDNINRIVNTFLIAYSKIR